ncbi:hypothetical protein BJY16_008580 [Actinoplanes octamycinicus]|uniref:Uncharacterized protein n=1 Tax=Actinoplanes octamycinicus TaxID=135948 RepID=A0A7W7H6Y3_9ACTN|nr:hypothetical protein [Actinoplanes octamycinicus]MBB4745121.1 hypothetical protein [Actinoplanes octamycinicus]
MTAMAGTSGVRPSHPWTSVCLIALLCYDVAVTVVGILFLHGQRDGFLRSAEVAPFNLWAASSAVGVLTLGLALRGSLAGVAARGAAELAWGLAWIRLLNLPVFVFMITAGFGVGGPGNVVAIMLMLVESVVTFACTVVVRRRLRREAERAAGSWTPPAR